MLHLFATFFPHKVLSKLPVLMVAGCLMPQAGRERAWVQPAPAGRRWGAEQRGICPGTSSCVRVFEGGLIFNTTRFAGGCCALATVPGQPRHWGGLLAGSTGNTRTDMAPGKQGLCTFHPAEQDPAAPDCKALWKIAVLGSSWGFTRLIQMHLQERHLQGCSHCFSLLRNRAVLREGLQRWLSALFSPSL